MPTAPVPRRSSPSVVVVGSINTDHVVRVERRPGPGETVGGATIELHAGGKGANQAVAAARCGATVAMVGRVGDDHHGRAQRAALDEEAVDVCHVAVTGGVSTGLAIVVVTPDGENSIIVAPGANADLSPGDVEGAATTIAGAAVLVAQLEIPVETVARSVELAGAESTVLLNCAPFRELPASALAATSVLVANEVEAAALSGRPTGSVDAVFDVAARIVGMGPRYAVVTMGRLGAVVVGGGERTHVPAKEAHVVDTTGAGDAFVGALAAALSDGHDLVAAVRYGVDVGSATTAHAGPRAAVPYRLEPRLTRP